MFQDLKPSNLYVRGLPQETRSSSSSLQGARYRQARTPHHVNHAYPQAGERRLQPHCV